MKLIIDISEEEYKFIKDLQFYSSGRRNGKTIEKHVINAIKNGTPYNPSGDLISRSEVMKLIPEVIGGQNEFADCIRDSVKQVIDTATTVEVPERPKGEWIGECYDPECDQCHTKPLEEFCDSLGLDGGSYVSIPMFFCPNCGADMRKGGEKE